MNIFQASLLFEQPNPINTTEDYKERLIKLLSNDLDFHNQGSNYASHDFHSFPAKFPPQLPLKFILELTNLGDKVLDPMMGSGTTILEAFLSGRHGVGFDIDPLALSISRTKVTPLDIEQVICTGNIILEQATVATEKNSKELIDILQTKWDSETRKFIDYWFAPETQIELLALIISIQKISDPAIKEFFELVFSATIITKSGGVSLAFDLGHTRPHRAKVVISKTGKLILGDVDAESSSPRIKFLTKTLRSTIAEFKKRFQQNIKSLVELKLGKITPDINPGNSQALPLDDSSIDLIVTSPPYASNAIDYMRAHKFSLVWMGYPVGELTEIRKRYIGSEDTANFKFEILPAYTMSVVTEITKLDRKRGVVLHRYYSEMARSIREMFRVLKPGTGAIVVVGSSIMRGRDTETHECLADMGRSIGFDVPQIGIRNLDRNRRMMPASMKVDLSSQIQQRMHEEYVIGFYKPK